MRTILTAGALALALMAAGSPAGAQEPTVPFTSITFDEAVSIALQQSSSIARARNQVALSGLDVSSATMEFVPDLRFSLSGDQDFGRTFNTDEGQILDGNTQGMNARMSSSVTLFDGFANVANRNQAKLGESAALLSAQRVEQSVVFSVIAGYIGLIEAREQVGVAEENLAFQQAREEEIQALVDGGSQPVADLYQQQAEVAAARASLVDARGTAVLAEVDLVQVLRLDPTGVYDFVAPTMPDDSEVAGDVDVPELLDRAFAARPDLAGLRTEVEAAEAGVSAARASYWPTIGLSASYGSSYSSATTSSVFDQFDDRKSGSLSLSLSVPLFDGRQAARATERARIQEYEAELALDDLRQQIALEVRRVAVDRESAVQRLAAAAAQVEAAERALEAVQERYGSGVATVFEVNQSQASYVSASSALVGARYTLLFQDELLDYYVGELDPAQALGS
ncbi:TolC family protein [Gaopeijia maritima]|uniref:TolC family protein n=1 Tax=Gaopeijia maritima TaxID=3119007 RepID=A0ABU9E6F8_9BACT